MQHEQKTNISVEERQKRTRVRRKKSLIVAVQLGQ
jgi:hypothetical protein